MRLNTTTPSVETGGDFGESLSFGIGNLALVLETLRSNMYSQPIKALTQEIGCNARDANIEAGRGDRPISIKLPTFADTEFAIQDYGIGISPKRAREVYTQFGSSTKRNDDKQIGKFGYGSKSPWAYTDSFNVTTITKEPIFVDKNGKHYNNVLVKRIWNAHIDETKCGKLLLCHEEVVFGVDTGTTISLDVKKEDIQKFTDAVKSVFAFWDPKPEINLSNWRWKEYKWLMQGKNWKIIDQNLDPYGYRNFSEQSFIVLDTIPYPINNEQILSTIKYHRDSEKVNQLLSFGIILYFENGILPITASRENIDYKPGVAERIRDTLIEVGKEIVARHSKEIEAESSFWKACIKANKLSGLNTMVRVEDFEWKKKKLKSSLQIPNDIDKWKLTGNINFVSINKVKYWDSQHINLDKLVNLTGFVIDDEKNIRPSISKCRTIVNDHKDSNFYILKKTDGAANSVIDDFIKNNDLEDFKILKLSQQSKTSAPKTGNTNVSTVKIKPIKLFEKDSYGYQRFFWKNHTVELDKFNGVYVELKRNTAYDTKIKTTEEISESIIWNISSVTKEPIYGILSKYISKVTNGTPFSDFVKKRVLDLEKTCQNYFTMSNKDHTQEILSYLAELNRSKIKNKYVLETLNDYDIYRKQKGALIEQLNTLKTWLGEKPPTFKEIKFDLSKFPILVSCYNCDYRYYSLNKNQFNEEIISYINSK